MKFRNIFFDLDGTLTDPYEGITKSIRYALEKMGVPAPTELGWCIGPPLKESFQILLEGHPHKTTEEAVMFYRERYTVKGLYENKIYNGIFDLLTSVYQADYNLYLVTAKPWMQAEKIIDYFKMRKFFKKIYGSELDGTRVNKADLIRYILELEGIHSTDAVMIGDRKHDLIGAKVNGLACVGVTWGHGTLEELEAEKPDKICTEPSELIDYLCILNNFSPRQI
jgi:phosphoglycolate phosphatase